VTPLNHQSVLFAEAMTQSNERPKGLPTFAHTLAATIGDDLGGEAATFAAVLTEVVFFFTWGG
jgi:hypothetical protein